LHGGATQTQTQTQRPKIGQGLGLMVESLGFGVQGSG
jgi:hypothetical protein